MKKYILIILFFIGAIANAQLYPVQVSQALTPPYPMKLSTFATTSQLKMQVFLMMRDLTLEGHPIRLSLHVQGGGHDIRSTQTVVGATPLFLDGGVQMQLTNFELRPYFEFQNLTGLTAAEYSQPLPQGMYTFTWEVYDMLTQQLISNPYVQTPVYLKQNDPPFLNIPNRGEQVMATDFQNLLFQWTPRHTGVGNVKYRFELRELWDDKIDPQAGFLSSPPYYTEETFMPMLQYDVSKPTLLPNKTYAWRVQAIENSIDGDASIFKNKGYSEIYYFRYNKDCHPPTFVLAEHERRKEVKVTWQNNPDHTKYKVQYKQADVEDAEWFEETTTDNTVTLKKLRYGKSYDFRVGGSCDGVTSLEPSFIYSPVQQFAVPEKDEAQTYTCGIVPEIEISNQDPLTNLAKNEIFTAGDFPVTVKEVNRDGDTYSGHGYVSVPYFADTKIAVEFRGIKVNTDYQLFDGVVETTYDANWGSMTDISDIIEQIKDVGQAISVALNLDVDSVTKENAEAIATAIVENAGEEGLSTETLEKVTKVAESFKTAGIAVAEAKQALENAKTDEEREAAEEALEQAKDDFEDAKEGVEDVQEDVEKEQEEMMELIKEAIYELYREGKSSKGDYMTNYQALFDALKGDEIEDDSFIIVDSVEISSDEIVSSENTGNDSQINEFYSSELTLVLYLFSETLSESQDSEIMSSFIKKAKENSIDFTTVIHNEELNDNEKIADLKTLLIDAYKAILFSNN